MAGRHVTFDDHDKALHDALSIDADTVDGQHASAFAGSGHNHDSEYINVDGDMLTGLLYGRMMIVNGLQSSRTAIHVPLDSDLNYWEKRGGTIDWDADAGVNPDNPSTLVSPHSGGNGALNIEFDNPGSISITFGGPSARNFNTFSNGGNRIFYMLHRGGQTPSEVLLEVLHEADAGTSNWETLVNDTSPSYTGNVWVYDASSHGLAYVNAYRLTLTFSGTGVSRISSFGLFHPNLAFGETALGYLGRSNTWHNNNFFNGLLRNNGYDVLTTASTIDADTVDGQHASAFATSGHNHDSDYANVSHIHDDRYYTETEIDTQMAGKASTTHNHSAGQITSGTLADARISASSVQQHIGKTYIDGLNINADTLDGQHASAFATSSHNHAAGDVTSGTFANARISAASVQQHVTKTYVDTLSIDADTVDGQHASAFATSGHNHDGDYAASSHNHSATNITSGTLAVARGGTGISSYTTGYFLKASGATTLQQRPPGLVLSDIGGFPSAGGTMTGELVIEDSGVQLELADSATPDAAAVFRWDEGDNVLHVGNKNYTATPQPIIGDLIIRGVAAPVGVSDVATKGYVDDKVGFGFKYLGSVYYTSGGTFTKANYPGLTAVRVKMVGGGGGSGSCSATGSGQGAAGGGGGAGAYTEAFYLESELPSSVTVTVGSGGSAESSGGESLFHSASAPGGSGGGSGSATTSGHLSNGGGGVGGAVGAGYFSYPGEAGETAWVHQTRMRRASGGRSHFGGGRVSGGHNTSGANGADGLVYGGGGDGAFNTGSQSARSGASGAPGVVIVEVYV